MCGSVSVYQMRSLRDGGREEHYRWRCYDCRKQYSVRTGTIFESTRLPLRVRQDRKSAGHLQVGGVLRGPQLVAQPLARFQAGQRQADARPGDQNQHEGEENPEPQRHLGQILHRSSDLTKRKRRSGRFPGVDGKTAPGLCRRARPFTSPL